VEGIKGTDMILDRKILANMSFFFHVAWIPKMRTSACETIMASVTIFAMDMK
jgi:hypothetical protein